MLSSNAKVVGEILANDLGVENFTHSYGLPVLRSKRRRMFQLLERRRNRVVKRNLRYIFRDTSRQGCRHSYHNKEGLWDKAYQGWQRSWNLQTKFRTIWTCALEGRWLGRWWCAYCDTPSQRRMGWWHRLSKRINAIRHGLYAWGHALAQGHCWNHGLLFYCPHNCPLQRWHRQDWNSCGSLQYDWIFKIRISQLQSNP